MDLAASAEDAGRCALPLHLGTRSLQGGEALGCLVVCLLELAHANGDAALGSRNEPAQLQVVRRSRRIVREPDQFLDGLDVSPAWQGQEYRLAREGLHH